MDAAHHTCIGIDKIMKIKKWLVASGILIFGLIGVTQVMESAQDIPFPVRYTTRISTDTSLNSSAVYKVLKDGSDKFDVTLYRTFIDENGEERKFSFGTDADHVAEFHELTALKDTSYKGMYYSASKLPGELIDKLQQIGVQVTSTELPWYIIGSQMWANGILAVVTWSMVLTFLVSYFASLNLYRKHWLVGRMLGGVKKTLAKSVASDLFIMAVVSIVLWGVYVLFNQVALSSLSSYALLATLGLNLVILMSFVVLINVVFFIIIKHDNLAKALKKTDSNMKQNLVWMAGILASLAALTLLMNQTVLNQKNLQQQLDSLKPWQKLSAYKAVNVTLPSIEDSNNGEIDARADTKVARRFMDHFKDDEYIFSQDSTAKVPNMVSQEQAQFMTSQLKRDGIDSDVSKRIRYMNLNALKLSGHRNLAGKVANKKPATVFLPEKFKDHKKSVLNAIYLEYYQNSGIKKSDFEVHIVKNNEKTFLFDYRGAELYVYDHSRLQTDTNRILVVINMAYAFNSLGKDATYSNVLNGLFKQPGLKKVAVDSSINGQVEDITSPYLSIQMQANRLQKRIVAAYVSMSTLVIMQLFAIFQFLMNIARKKAYTMGVKRLLGYNIVYVILREFGGYILTIFAGLVVAWFMTSSMVLKNVVLGLNVMAIVIIIGYVRFYVKKASVNVLKGDFEL